MKYWNQTPGATTVIILAFHEIFVRPIIELPTFVRRLSLEIKNVLISQPIGLRE